MSPWVSVAMVVAQMAVGFLILQSYRWLTRDPSSGIGLLFYLTLVIVVLPIHIWGMAIFGYQVPMRGWRACSEKEIGRLRADYLATVAKNDKR